LAEEVAGPFWRDSGWVLIGFDGSRACTPRTVSNEREFCATNYGHGKTAKYEPWLSYASLSPIYNRPVSEKV
jgi:hypothetical protein